MEQKTPPDRSADDRAPRKGDGTQPAPSQAGTSREKPKRANWYGPSERPMEEFIGDQPNRMSETPPPPRRS